MSQPSTSGLSLLKTCGTLLSAVALSSVLFTSPIQAETTYRLSLSIIGTGQVNGDLSCLSGTACPQQEITAGNTIHLVATPTIDTLFEGWLGCTTTLGNNCTVVMDTAKDLYALFMTAPVAKNQQTGQEYSSVLQAAYDTATDGETIMMRVNSAQLTGGLVADKDIRVSLKGGYTADYSGTQAGYTTLQGPVTIKSGTVIADRLIVAPALDTAVFAAPLLASVTDRHITIADSTDSFVDSNGVQNTFIQLASDAAFTGVLSSLAGLTGGTFAGLNENTTYYLRITGQTKNSATGLWEDKVSPTLTVTTLANVSLITTGVSGFDMTAATDLGPSNTDNITKNNTPTFSWDAKAGATSYIVQVDS